MWLDLVLWIIRGGDGMTQPTTRTLAEVEADLRIQSVLVGHERARHTINDETDPDVLRLNELIDEWVTLTRSTV
jgi:hypothetical protein